MNSFKNPSKKPELSNLFSQTQTEVYPETKIWKKTRTLNSSKPRFVYLNLVNKDTRTLQKLQISNPLKWVFSLKGPDYLSKIDNIVHCAAARFSFSALGIFFTRNTRCIFAFSRRLVWLGMICATRLLGLRYLLLG